MIDCKLKLDVFKKYASYYEDEVPRPQPSDFVVLLFEGREDGSFIDVGAHNGILWSNTLVLEEGYGWNGICVEPHPINFEKLKENRKSDCLNVGLSDVDGELEFCRIDGYAEMLSGFTKFYCANHKLRVENEIKDHPDDKVSYIDVPSRKLSDILKEKELDHVNYLSIDTEGSELQVLKGADLEKNIFELISCEDNYEYDDVQKYLEKFNYRYLTKVCGDKFYAHESSYTTDE
jgi:FkbM family methyltransferase